MARKNLAPEELCVFPGGSATALPANDEGLEAAVAGIRSPFYNDGTKWMPLEWGANQFKPVVGRVYGPPCNTSSGSAQTNGTQRVAPYFVPYRMTVDRIYGFVNTQVGSSLLRPCIYEDDGTGYPGALFFDPGANFDGNVLGLASITISQVIEPGLYWFGGRASGAVNMRTVNGQQNLWTYFTGTEDASAFTSLAIQAFTVSPGASPAFPGLPDPFPAGAVASGTLAAVKVRCSAVG